MQGQGFTCCPWIGRTYITVQWSMMQYSDRIFNSRIFLLIYSSVGYRNLSHQVIEDSSQHNHFNNLYGTVSMPQILCCINCISLSFEFYWNFRAHTCHLSFVFSIGEGAKSRALLKVRLTIFIGHCLAEWSFSMQLCSRICWFEDNRIDPIDRRKSTKHERGDVALWKFNEDTQYFFCIATQLQFQSASIIADLSNAE